MLCPAPWLSALEIALSSAGEMAGLTVRGAGRGMFTCSVDQAHWRGAFERDAAGGHRYSMTPNE